MLFRAFCFGLVAFLAQSASATTIVPEDRKFLEQNLAKYVDTMRSRAASAESKKLSTFYMDGWTANLVLSAILDGYTITKDRRWLEDFAFFANDALNYRADVRSIPDFRGRIRPQWHRLDRFSIFSISPFKIYTPETRDAVMKERGWQNLRFSDINYDGLFLEPMLRFAKIVKDDTKLKPISDRIVTFAKETVASHEAEWSALSADKGYYIFERGSPIYLDGFEMPLNEAAIFSSALVDLFELTSDRQYIGRAEAMLNNWLDYVTYDAAGTMWQPYVTGMWFKTGWTSANSPSINTPEIEPNRKAEIFHKASITVSFLNKFVLHSERPDVKKYRDGFYGIFRNEINNGGNQISFFPFDLSPSFPTDTRHVVNPAQYRGFAEIEDADIWRLMYLMAYGDFQANPNTIFDILAVAAHSPTENLPSLEKSTFKISPYRIGEQIGEGCLYRADSDQAVNLYFRRKSRMHSRVFLSPSPEITDRGIRLSHKDGELFTGRAYLRKGDCVNWRWAQNGQLEYSQPPTQAENVVEMTVFSDQPAR